MHEGNIVLSGTVQSEGDQMPGSVMFNIRLSPVGQSEMGVPWSMMLTVSDELAEHPLLTRKKKIKVTISEG